MTQEYCQSWPMQLFNHFEAAIPLSNQQYPLIQQILSRVKVVDVIEEEEKHFRFEESN